MRFVVIFTTPAPKSYQQSTLTLWRFAVFCLLLQWCEVIQHDATACCRLLFDLFVACKIRQLSWPRTGTWGCSGIEPARASSTAAGASCRDVPLLLWGTYRLGYCVRDSLGFPLSFLPVCIMLRFLEDCIGVGVC